MVKLYFSLLIISLCFNVSKASSLSQVRSIVNADSSFDLAYLAGKRVQKIRENLGTDDIRIDGLEGLNPLVSNKKRSFGSTDFIKRFYRSAVIDIREKTKYGAPQVVDPSTMWHEVRGKEDEYFGKMMLEFTNKIQSDLDVDLETLFLTYSANVVEKDSSRDVRCKDLGSTAVSSADISSRIAHNVLSNHLNKNLSLGNNLGFIRRIDIKDGRVSKLKLTSCNAAPFGSKVNLSDLDETTINISILISILTKNDDFFLETQRQFIKLVSDEINKLEEKDKELTTDWGLLTTGGLEENDKAKLNIFKSVKSYLISRNKGAQAVHDNVASLSQQSLKKFLDLFLQIQFAEIPSAEDIIAMRDYHMGMTQKMNSDGSFAKANADSFKVFEADFVYFKSLHEDLYILENYLTEARSNQGVVDEMIKDIKEEQP